MLLNKFDLTPECSVPLFSVCLSQGIPVEIFNILQIIKEFIAALEAREPFEELKRFYHKEVVQTEFPNGLAKHTISRNLADLEAASLRNRQVLQKEFYEVVKEYVAGNTVVLEVVWRGILGMPMAKMKAGTELKGYFVQVFEFKEGKIYRQRNYDCFEPFA